MCRRWYIQCAAHQFSEEICSCIILINCIFNIPLMLSGRASVLQHSELCEIPGSSLSMIVTLLGRKQCDRASDWEMFHGDAYHKKTFGTIETT